jgi:hypothetical protein
LSSCAFEPALSVDILACAGFLAARPCDLAWGTFFDSFESDRRASSRGMAFDTPEMLLKMMEKIFQ